MSITLGKLGLIQENPEKPNYFDINTLMIFIHQNLFEDEALDVNKKFLAFIQDNKIREASFAFNLLSNKTLLRQILSDPKQPTSLIENVVRFNDLKSLDITIQGCYRIKVYDEAILGMAILQREFIGDIKIFEVFDLPPSQREKMVV